MAGLQLEAMRQAVMLGHRSVQTTALLLAIMSLDEQLAVAGRKLRTAYLPSNGGGRVLSDAGVSTHRIRQSAESISDAGGELPVGESVRRVWDSGKIGDLVWGLTAARVMDRAGAIAGARGHRHIGTSHLLAAVLEDTSSAAMRVLTELGVDCQRLRSRIDEQFVSGEST
jgi:hypothetical protein